MGLVNRDDGWRIPDATWQRMEPLLPPRPPHPLGCHNPRVPDREAMNAILLVLRSGMRWNALNATGICSSSSAHRRFQEWAAAGVFEEFWRQGLLAYDELQGIEWEWLSCDGLMGKAPLGGEETGPNPTDRAKKGGSARCSATVGAPRSESRSQARTSTTSGCFGRRSRTS
jgi:transposase